MSSRESSIKAVKKICELLEVEFSEDFLTWEALEEMDPSWEVPLVARHCDKQFGFFLRANTSTTFEDGTEREVDLDALAAEKSPEMIADIKKAQVVYREMCAMAEQSNQ